MSMMKLKSTIRFLLIFTVIAIPLCSQAQKQFYVPQWQFRDSVGATIERIAASESQWLSQLDLPVLITDTGLFHLRYHPDEQYVDIWTSDLVHFQGRITHYVKRYEHKQKWRDKHPAPFLVLQV